MLRGEFEPAGESTPDDLLAAYETRLREIIDAAGVDSTSDDSGVDRETITALANGESVEVSLSDATAILALDDDLPDADTIEAEALDVLLMGMTTAVMDVDAVAGALDGAMDPKEIQQKIEGRFPMTIEEYARIHHAIESG
jgi:hypothetical protein